MNETGGSQAQISAVKRSRKPWSRGGFAIKEDDFKFVEQFKVQVGQPGGTGPGGRNSELECRQKILRVVANIW